VSIRIALIEGKSLKNMVNSEKEQFCAFGAALLAPPDAALLSDLQQEGLRDRIGAYAQGLGGDGILPVFFDEAGNDDFLPTLQRAYESLFVDLDGKRVSLVESTYKPWTEEKGCGMVFASSKGLVMGDAAIHMLDVYEQLSLEVPEEFRSTPDHLVLELEFLALLYQSASQEVIKGFIADHLDWVPELRGEMEKADPHPFYRTGVELIQLFLEHELKNEEV
jgi:putative dimethyl sulfoxide reductase chaperone